MTDDEHARALVRRSVLELSPLQKYQPETIRLEEHPGLLLAAMGGGDIDDNYVFVYGDANVDLILDLAEAFFGRGAYAISVESDTNDEIEKWLRAEHWIVYEDEPQMLLTPVPSVDEQSTELTVELVENEEQYEEFMRISETGRRWVPSLEAATDPKVALFVGYLEGNAVATARLSCLGDLGNIHGVVTDPRFRRKGFGTEMTWAAIAEGRRRGCSSIVLSASDMGFPVYRRMGFHTVCRFRIYVPEGTPA